MLQVTDISTTYLLNLIEQPLLGRLNKGNWTSPQPDGRTPFETLERGHLMLLYDLERYEETASF